MTAALVGGCGGSSSHLSPAAAPHDVLAAARSALQATPDYHITGMLDEDFVVDLNVDHDDYVGTVTSHGVTWAVTRVGGRLFFRGRSLWDKSVSAERAAALGEQWVEVVSMNAAWGWAAHLADLQSEIVNQVFRDKPGLHNAGVRRFARQRVIELSSPKDIYDVRAGVPHLPLRWLEPDEIGADGKPCGVVLDRFGRPTRVTVPATSLRY